MKAEQLAALKALERPDGTINPNDVVETARSPGSVLHTAFHSWDIKVLAQERLLEIASDLIKQYRIEVSVRNTTMRIEVPGYVRDPNAPHDQRGYKNTERVRGHREEEIQVLFARLRSAKAQLQNASSLALYFGINNTLLEDAVSATADFLEDLESGNPSAPKRDGQRKTTRRSKIH